MRPDTKTRTREHRIRRIAERRGIAVQKSPRRDVQAIDYALWKATGRDGMPLVPGRTGFTLTLDEVEDALR